MSHKQFKPTGRREFGRRCAILLFATVVEIALVASPTSRVLADGLYEVLKKIKDISEKLQKLTDWADWTVDTGFRMLDEHPKPARPPPGSMKGDEFEKALLENSKKVEALSLPGFSYVETDLINLRALSRDDARGRLRAATANFRATFGEVINAQAARGSLDRMRTQVIAQNSALRQTAELAPAIIQKFPTVTIYNEFTMQFGAISLSYIPLNEKLQDAIGEKLREFDDEIEKEKSELKGVADYITNGLHTEQEELRSDLEDISKAAELLKERQKGIDSNRSTLAIRQQEASRLEAYIQATMLDIQQAEAAEDDTKDEIAQLNNNINGIRGEIQALNAECGGTNIYGECQNIDQRDPNRRAQNEWRAKMSSAQTRLSQAHAAIPLAQLRLKQIGANLARLNDELDSEQQSQRQQADLVESLQRELSSLQSQWDADFKIAEEEKWKSRADVYMAQSLQDEQSLKAFVSSL